MGWLGVIPPVRYQLNLPPWLWRKCLRLAVTESRFFKPEIATMVVVLWYDIGCKNIAYIAHCGSLSVHNIMVSEHAISNFNFCTIVFSETLNSVCIVFHLTIMRSAPQKMQIFEDTLGLLHRSDTYMLGFWGDSAWSKGYGYNIKHSHFALKISRWSMVWTYPDTVTWMPWMSTLLSTFLASKTMLVRPTSPLHGEVLKLLLPLT
jgi:hypothetical protein